MPVQTTLRDNAFALLSELQSLTTSGEVESFIEKAQPFHYAMMECLRDDERARHLKWPKLESDDDFRLVCFMWCEGEFDVPQ